MGSIVQVSNPASAKGGGNVYSVVAKLIARGTSQAVNAMRFIQKGVRHGRGRSLNRTLMFISSSGYADCGKDVSFCICFFEVQIISSYRECISKTEYLEL